MSAKTNIALAKTLGLEITWADVKPSQSFIQAADFSQGERVPDAVLKQYKSTKGLGKTIAKQFDGKAVVRTNPEDGHVYILPVTALGNQNTE